MVCILGLVLVLSRAHIIKQICSKTSLVIAMHTSSMIEHSNTNLGCIKNVESFKELVVSVGGLALVAISLFYSAAIVII